MQNMKSFLLLILLAFTVLNLFSQHVWTVQTVPNTRLESNEIHVSDPDGYLSDSAEMNINTALCAFRDKADVFVVTLSSIGDEEPKRFATQLFNNWSIGDSETNNGVLLLFVEDQHALEFETGYGAEETLTDAKCERIFSKTIVPYFREGDYEGGLCAGVGEIVAVYGGEIPLGLVSVLPEISDESGGTDDDIPIIFLLFALLVFALPVIGIVFWLYKRNDKKSSVSDTYKSFEENGATYYEGFKTAWSGSPWEGYGCLGGLTLGFSVFVILFVVIGVMNFCFPDLEEKRYFNWIAVITTMLYLTWICFRQNHRVLKTADILANNSVNPKSVYEAANNHTANKVAMWMAPWLGWVYYRLYKKRLETSEGCMCPKCHATMRKDGAFKLPEQHLAEKRAGALKFTPYRCANGHSIVVKEHGDQFSKFSTCAKCGAYTLKLTQSETKEKATYSQSGKKELIFECQHCGDVVTKLVTIPMLVHYSSSSSSSSSSSGRSYSSHHSSSHSSRGSFGGGRSGGGGYSGRW